MRFNGSRAFILRLNLLTRAVLIHQQSAGVDDRRSARPLRTRSEHRYPSSFRDMENRGKQRGHPDTGIQFFWRT